MCANLSLISVLMSARLQLYTTSLITKEGSWRELKGTSLTLPSVNEDMSHNIDFATWAYSVDSTLEVRYSPLELLFLGPRGTHPS